MTKTALILLALAAALSCARKTEEPIPAKVAVVTPRGYTPGVKYPACIALHGAGSYKEEMMAFWKSPELSDSYVVAYVESTENASGGGFTWTFDIPQARQQILACYWDLRLHYSIDTTKVMVSGFSAGGAMAIDLFLNDVIPAKAFICLCPGMPASFSRERAEAAAGRGLRGVFIAGETDFFREEQRQMLEVFAEVGLDCGYVLVPGVGHQVPPGFADLLDSALDTIGWEPAGPVSPRETWSLR